MNPAFLIPSDPVERVLGPFAEEVIRLWNALFLSTNCALCQVSIIRLCKASVVFDSGDLSSRISPQ